MEVKTLTATLEERVSKKGVPYKGISLKLTPNYEKIIFLLPSEIELINATKSNVDFSNPFKK